MRRLSTFLIVLFISSLLIPAKAQENKDESITWYSFEKAIEINKAAKKKKKKKFFVDVYTDWCGWCKKMDASTFTDKQVAEVMNKYFYAVKLNAERKDTVKYNGNIYVNPSPNSSRSTHQLALTLLKGQLAYPSFVVMNKDESVITTIMGYREPKDLIPLLTYYGEDIYLTKTWAEYQQSLTSPGK